MDPVHSLVDPDSARGPPHQRAVCSPDEPALAPASAPVPPSVSAAAPAPTPTPTPIQVQVQPLPGPASSLSPALSPTSVARPDASVFRPSVYSPASFHFAHPASPPPRKDTISSVSTQATTATLASTESTNTSYSADTSPRLHQSIFSLRDGSDVSNSRRTSRRRTGPLSQQSRERAALIRKLGACADCRRRRVACHPSHHNLTWEDLVQKFHRAYSPGMHEIAPSLAGAQASSPGSATLTAPQQASPPDHVDEMDLDSASSKSQTHSGRLSLSDARVRTPLPSGPRLEKALSLPGIESLKNELQSNVPKMLSTTNRGRYSTVHCLLLHWQDDDDVAIVHKATKDLAEVFDKYYHYALEIRTIPSSSSDACKSSWRWLSRLLNEFAEERDQRDVLKIVYYAGFTYLDGNREMILSNSRDFTRASTIRWGGIQQSLEEACADTLVIMDAAFYSSSRMVRQNGVLELIAASVSDLEGMSSDRCAFTRSLVELLRARATRSAPLSAVELHANLLATYPKLYQGRSVEGHKAMAVSPPLHVMMAGNPRLPSIFLSPIYQNHPFRHSFSSENSPQLHLSIKLHDDHVDIDSWNEWLRLMPEGIKDVRVEGPFRTSFR